MGIFQRTADILAANLNDLVDRFEEPERMLRQALREMEALLATTLSAVAQSIAAEKLLVKARDDHAAQAEQWQRRAADAVGDGDDALARRALARNLEHERATATADRQVVAAHQSNESLRRQLDLIRDQREAARTKLMLLTAQRTAIGAQRQVYATSRVPSRRTRAWARFERFYEQVEFAQAEAAALVELETCGELELEPRFDRRATERAIDEELTRLKASPHPADG